MAGGRPRKPLEVQRGFWQRIRAGDGIEVAARVVGVSSTTAGRWFGHAGGVFPSFAAEPQGRRLTFADREEIASLRAAGGGVRSIAKEMGWSASTISRELARCPVDRQHRGPYRASVAQAQVDVLSRRPKPTVLATNLVLRRRVVKWLKLNHSPEQISARLREDYPDDQEMRVSPETIYQSIYIQGRGGLSRDLAKHLRTGRALRKPRRKEGERLHRLAGMVNISERPAEAADRAVPGHWEGDLIVRAFSGSAIGTLVERSTRFTMLLHLPDDHGALAVQDAIVAKMAQLPDLLRRTLTWDQGIELTNHAKIAIAADLDIYFCDPPWQRGTNENTNGLLRQYFPKGTDLLVHGPGYLDFVAAGLNNRPRKTLKWRTPAEALNQLLSDAGRVALTG